MTPKYAKWIAAVVAIGAVCVAAGIALASTSAGGGHPNTDEVAVQASPVEALADQLQRAHITCQPANPSGKEILSDQAVETARNELPLVGDSEATTELVTYTDSAYGHENAKSNSEPSDITPKYVDREAWAVVFDKTRIPILGGPMEDRTANDGNELTYSATTVVFIDAQSGEYLEAVSI